MEKSRTNINVEADEKLQRPGKDWLMNTHVTTSRWTDDDTARLTLKLKSPFREQDIVGDKDSSV